MNVVRFPVVPKQRPEDEPVTVMTAALAHIEQLVGIYREVGARPNPVTILMMIASILDEPELRKVANLVAGFDAPVRDKSDELTAACDDPHDNAQAEKAG